MTQKATFLASEGDAWFARNEGPAAHRKLPDGDGLLMALLDIFPAPHDQLRILEVGCSDGARLAWLKDNLAADCHGIDPSAQAVAAARARGVAAQQGTADRLEFDDGSFDVVLFGFCLYLCDREDLFQIASEADRVLREPGWLLIADFFSPTPRARSYHHRPGVLSYKMDYRSLFTWHPDYECLTHTVRHHGESTYTDDSDEWVGVSVLRKFHREPSV